MRMSIAVPAIGTGNLHIPHALVAKWMYDEANEFGQKNPNATLCDIRFVVYDKDKPTVAVGLTGFFSVNSSFGAGFVQWIHNILCTVLPSNFIHYNCRLVALVCGIAIILVLLL